MVFTTMVEDVFSPEEAVESAKEDWEEDAKGGHQMMRCGLALRTFTADVHCGLSVRPPPEPPGAVDASGSKHVHACIHACMQMRLLRVRPLQASGVQQPAPVLVPSPAPARVLWCR